MAVTADPVRDQVEITLRRLVDTVTAVPCGAVRAVQGAASQSAAIVRTIVTLTVDALLGWDVDAGVPPLGGTAAAGVGATASADGTDQPQGSPGEREADAGVARRARDAGAALDAAELAIAGYEDLAASHIVARLDGLERDDLMAIRRFETAHRGRRTVVGKIDQLLAHP
jgi:hypothetical protein